MIWEICLTLIALLIKCQVRGIDDSSNLFVIHFEFRFGLIKVSK